MIQKNEKALEELKSYVTKWKDFFFKIQEIRKDFLANVNIEELFDILPKKDEGNINGYSAGRMFEAA